MSSRTPLPTAAATSPGGQAPCLGCVGTHPTLASTVLFTGGRLRVADETRLVQVDPETGQVQRSTPLAGRPAQHGPATARTCGWPTPRRTSRLLPRRTGSRACRARRRSARCRQQHGCCLRGRFALAVAFGALWVLDADTGDLLPTDPSG